MTRRIRIISGIIILAVSIAILIWGYKPLDREVRKQPLDPSQLQLPTPISLLVPPELVS